MTLTLLSAPAVRRGLIVCTALGLSSPSLADHMGPSGVGASGMAVSGPETLDAGHWAAAFRLLYTRLERRSDAELEALSAQDIDAHNTDYNLNGALGLAYGLNHHLTISAELPYVRREKLRAAEAGDGVERLGSISGIGDMSLLAKYRLTDGGGSGFALIGGIKMPTGSTHKRSGDGERLETEHQPGTGSWDPIAGASLGTEIGPLNVSASALYQFSGKGAQHTRLGERLQGGIALSHRFGEAAHQQHETHNHHHGDELDEHHQPAPSTWAAFVELGGEWEGRQKVDGEVEEASGGAWMYAAPGVRFTSASGWSVGGAVALPLWQHIRASHPDNRYRAMVSIGRTF
jgi:hypothetical protein